MKKERSGRFLHGGGSLLQSTAAGFLPYVAGMTGMSVLAKKRYITAAKTTGSSRA